MNASERFKSLINEYFILQSEHKENSRKRLRRQIEIAGIANSNEEVEQMLESNNPKIFTQQILADANIAKQQLADIEARHKEIIKLERDMVELNEIFVDLSLLIEDQGVRIDSIEANVVKTTDEVEMGQEKLVEARTNQKKARKVTIFYWSFSFLLNLFLALLDNNKITFTN